MACDATGARRDRPFVVAVIAIFLLALSIRVALTQVYVGLSSPPDGGANPDQIEYEHFAHKLSTGAGYVTASNRPTASRPPGTSFFLLPVYSIFGRDYAAGRLWFCFLSATTCIAVAMIGMRISGPACGLLAAAWLALLPNHAYYAMHFLSETPFSFALAFACLLTIRALGEEQISRVHYVLAGVLWGVAVLVRPHIALALPLLWLLVLFRDERRRALEAVVGICLAAALVVGPWVARNAYFLGAPTVSTIGGLTFWGAHNEEVFARLPGGWYWTAELSDAQHSLEGAEAHRASLAWRYGREFLAEHLSELPYLAMMKVYRFLSPWYATENSIVRWAFAIGWITAGPLSVAGAFLAWRHDRRTTLVLLVPFIATLLTVVIFYGSTRFRDSLAPLYVLFGAHAAVVLGNRLSTYSSAWGRRPYHRRAT